MLAAEGKLAAIDDEHLYGGSISLVGSHLLHLQDHVEALHHPPEDDMLHARNQVS